MLTPVSRITSLIGWIKHQYRVKKRIEARALLEKAPLKLLNEMPVDVVNSHILFFL
jgi:hypothetical protein